MNKRQRMMWAAEPVPVWFPKFIDWATIYMELLTGAVKDLREEDVWDLGTKHHFEQVVHWVNKPPQRPKDAFPRSQRDNPQGALGSLYDVFISVLHRDFMSSVRLMAANRVLPSDEDVAGWWHDIGVLNVALQRMTRRLPAQKVASRYIARQVARARTL